MRCVGGIAGRSRERVVRNRSARTAPTAEKPPTLISAAHAFPKVRTAVGPAWASPRSGSRPRHRRGVDPRSWCERDPFTSPSGRIGAAGPLAAWAGAFDACLRTMIPWARPPRVPPDHQSRRRGTRRRTADDSRRLRCRLSCTAASHRIRNQPPPAPPRSRPRVAGSTPRAAACLPASTATRATRGARRSGTRPSWAGRRL